VQLKYPIKYRNGNVLVRLYEDGTKFRYCSGDSKPEYPECVDLKITNKCNIGCPYCHENSRKNGKHADLDETFEKIKCLPSGVEIAIGGGDPTEHPGLPYFLEKLSKAGYVTSVTVRWGRPLDWKSSSLLTGALGVSGTPIPYVKSIRDPLVIHHVIAGITDVEDLIHYKKVLVLGFKKFGRAKNINVDENLKNWYFKIHRYIGTRHIMFDNLAIQQLGLKRFFSDEGWEKIYMGNDGQYTMYVDAVEGKFAINSTTPKRNRVPWNDIDLLKFFKGGR
jgi:hypothetical protein